MKILIAVIEDLRLFVFDIVSRLFSRRPSPQARAHESQQERVLPMPETVSLLEGGTEVVEEVKEHEAEDGLSFQHSYEGISPVRNTIMYVRSDEILFRTEPTVLRDTAIGTLPYGSMVMVLEGKNGWVRVHNNGLEGWVETRDLASYAADVFPQFTVGDANEADSANTIRVRAMIKDEFSCGAAGLDLRSEEYVLYRLLRNNVQVMWSRVRPRTPGHWTSVLGESGYRTSGHPEAHSVMEYQMGSHGGHLAYVEALFPDESIQISEANWPDRGIYNERVLVKEEWTTLTPSFIHLR